MQKFTYHTHNNNLGVFDGHNTAEEMIARAEELGFETIGVSNHLIWHPNVGSNHLMFFEDLDTAIDIHKQNVDIIREAGQKHKIQVLVGAETDFFTSAIWRQGFEKITKAVDFDYLIASNHFLKNQDESLLCNLYHLGDLPADLPKEIMAEYIRNHWQNIVESIQSGYFNFLAHPDYCVIKLADCAEYDEYRWQIVEALDKAKLPFEVNTSGFNRIGEQHPNTWMLKELCKRGVPTLISDDAHRVEDLGQHFERAERLLESCNCQSRFELRF